MNKEGNGANMWFAELAVTSVDLQISAIRTRWILPTPLMDMSDGTLSVFYLSQKPALVKSGESAHQISIQSPRSSCSNAHTAGKPTSAANGILIDLAGMHCWIDSSLCFQSQSPNIKAYVMEDMQFRIQRKKPLTALLKHGIGKWRISC